MSRVFAVADIRPGLPSLTQSRSPVLQAMAVLLGTAVLTASSWIAVPMVPVPITLQTLAVTMIGAFFGWRLATLTVLAWLAEAASGLPVLSGGHAGLAYMAGPTGGYLLAFAVAAALVGWTADRGVLNRSVGHALVVMLAANLLILAIGGAWLAGLIGAQAAMVHGVMPFLLGGAIKAGLAAGLIDVACRFVGTRQTGR